MSTRISGCFSRNSSLALLGLLALVGCRKAETAREHSDQQRLGSSKPGHAAANSVPVSKEMRGAIAGSKTAKGGDAPDPPMTPERVRAFVVETHFALDRIVSEAYKQVGQNPKPNGKCADGQPALLLVRAQDALPVFEKRLEGQALQCYLATFFRCKVDGWLAHAVNQSNVGPENVPFLEAKVKIIEQGPTRIVADVQEAEPVDVLSDGRIDREKVVDLNFDRDTRYTLHRDGKGVWRIAERVTPDVPMDCQQY